MPAFTIFIMTIAPGVVLYSPQIKPHMYYKYLERNTDNYIREQCVINSELNINIFF